LQQCVLQFNIQNKVSSFPSYQVYFKMFNLSEIMQAAQGGQGINNIATHFGLSPEQAQSAVQALMPGMSMGLQNQAANSGGLASIIEMMTGGAHHEAFNNPNATAAPQTASAGADILHQIFGGQAGAEAVAQHATNTSGISASVMQSLMPIVASMIMGGLFKGASNNGLGSLLNSLTGASNTATQASSGGMLGDLLGSFMGSHNTPPATAQSGFNDMLGGLMGSLMGGAQPAAQPHAEAAPNPMASGIEMLQSMLNHGQQVQAAHTNALQDILNGIIKK
jgi:hypothetical protein